MNNSIDTFFTLAVLHEKLDFYIQQLEDALLTLKEGPFHSVIGKSFLHHAEDLAQFLLDFHESASENGTIEVIYFEINGFSINPDLWYCNGFGYRKRASLWDLTTSVDWLHPWDFDTEDFNLAGLELTQEAFRKYNNEEQCLGGRYM